MLVFCKLTFINLNKLFIVKSYYEMEQYYASGFRHVCAGKKKISGDHIALQGGSVLLFPEETPDRLQTFCGPDQDYDSWVMNVCHAKISSDHVLNWTTELLLSAVIVWPCWGCRPGAVRTKERRAWGRWKRDGDGRRDYLVQEKGEETRRIIGISARGRERITVSRAGFQNNPLRVKSCTLFTAGKI